MVYRTTNNGDLAKSPFYSVSGAGVQVIMVWFIPVLLEDAGRSYCHALIPEPRPWSSVMHGVEARAQEILGLGAWGKGVQRSGRLKHALTLPPI